MITFKLRETSPYGVASTLGPHEDRDAAGAIIRPSNSLHPNVEADARDVCYRGKGFPNDMLMGESGSYAAFVYEPTLSLRDNVAAILASHPELDEPVPDAWWPLVAGKSGEGTEGLRGYYLINPSNPPRPKVEGFGGIRLPILVYRTPEHYGPLAKPGWYLSSIWSEEDGRIDSGGDRCLIYFRRRAAMSPFRVTLGLYYALTGKEWSKERKREPKPELTAYGKSVIAKMDTLPMDRPVQPMTPERLAQAENEVREKLAGKVVSEATFHLLAEHASHQCLSNVHVAAPDTVVAYHDDFTWKGSGGSNYYSCLFIWHNGTKLGEANMWRDGRSASGDRPDLRIVSIGQIAIDGDSVMIEINNGDYVRQRRFTLRPKQSQMPAVKQVAAPANVPAANTDAPKPLPGFIRWLGKVFN